MLVLTGCPAPEQEPGRPLTGEILEVLPDQRLLVVRHEEIPGYMPAGTVEVLVSRGDAANASAGQFIRGRLTENGGKLYLAKVWPADRMSQGIMDRTSRTLMEDTMVRGSRAFREVGEVVPSFALYNQNNEVVQINRHRGRSFVLNFIYSRCPSPEMCPAATQRMIQLQKAAKEAGIEDFELFSVSLDPNYDTPGVLREYADNHAIDTANYSFLTGPEQATSNLMEQFGILVDPEIGVESHTLSTILVDESGRIRHRVFGSNWMVGDFLQRLQALDSTD